ncbi:hypothetical protein [Desulfurococcus mucosus]|uniref:Uncharacterized protein n=1 Tax=Desulfurococcus mucosus (strain ATCC 35584 / DSM 2162 / JCM 9187 / O7/1) TaxID=765177 RepID=E8R7X7_DESM0|nr:hypothetical protein [Desulfurococcus mucosus]ADV64603.1 hypothetical protein Desmu_0284 [Desulfurococcus mucosus DSM 2162]
MKATRAVSEVVAAVILFTVAVAISLAVFFYTAFYTDYVKALTEYGHVKTVLWNIADVISTQGYMDNRVLEYRYPHEVASIGYEFKRVNLTVNLTLSNGSTVTVSRGGCYVLKAAVARPVLTNMQPTLLRGVNETLVNDTLLVPSLYEYYSNGWSILVLDACRIYYSVKNIGGSLSLELFFFNFTSVNNEYQPPLVTGQGYLVVSPVIRVISENYNVTSVTVNGAPLPGIPSNTILYKATIYVVNTGIMIG